MIYQIGDWVEVTQLVPGCPLAVGDVWEVTGHDKQLRTYLIQPVSGARPSVQLLQIFDHELEPAVKLHVLPQLTAAPSAMSGYWTGSGIVNAPMPSAASALSALTPKTLQEQLDAVMASPVMAPRVCTCGSAAVGSDRHSGWCDLA